MYLQCVKRSLMQRHNMFSVNITENCPGHRSENCVCTVCVKEREGVEESLMLQKATLGSSHSHGQIFAL